jgi:hypothetical protein
LKFGVQFSQLSTPQDEHVSLPLYGRKLADRWYGGVLSELLNSKQQDLTLHTIADGGLGRVLERADHSAVTTLSGVPFSREHYTNEAADSGKPIALNVFSIRSTTCRRSKTSVPKRFFMPIAV